MVAFVAEFSRGKSELINAIFFADFGERLLPSAAGRTTMCPTELLHDPSLPPSIRLLPIDTRARDATVAEFKSYPDEWVTLRLDLSSAERMSEALSRVSQVKRVPVELARSYGFPDDDEGRGAAAGPVVEVEIPCWRHAIINFPHPLLEAGPGDPRHAGAQRHRHRARAHTLPAARGARRALHPRRRRRRHQDRPRRLESAPRGGGRGDPARSNRRAEQDRRPLGRPQERRRDRRRNRPTGAFERRDARRTRRTGVRGVGAEGAARPRSTATTRCWRKAGCRCSRPRCPDADPGEARHRRQRRP